MLKQDPNRLPPTGPELTCGGACVLARVAFLLALLLGCIDVGVAAELRDMFDDRETVTTESGLIPGDNITATIEPGEPRHGERPGGASVWISWVAPTNCIATFTTDGSLFDTTLTAYYVEEGDPAIFDKLHRAAENDDEIGSASTVVFGAYAGRRYEIAVDGYRGEQGTIKLAWSIEPVGDLPPIILSTPGDQALQEGAPLTLSVALQNPSSYELDWSLNGIKLIGQESATLHIPALARSELGQYRLRLELGEFKLYSKPIEIQINSEGLVDSLARDKLYDALDSGNSEQTLSGINPTLQGIPGTPTPRVQDGVNRGYNGSQIFNTINATASPDEPPICGHNGAVTWFAYQPPESGTLVLNSVGSEVGVALTAFAYDEPLTTISQLSVITCDSPPAEGAFSGIECAVLTGRTYIIGIVGIGEARGVVKLNYQLDMLRLPAGPSVFFGGAELTAVAGKPLVLSASVAGSPPLHFTWLKNGVELNADDAGALIVASAAPTDAGLYAVRVHNHIAETLSDSLAVRVLIPPALQIEPGGGKMILSFDTVSQQSYGLEYRDPSGSDVWLPLGSTLPGSGGTMMLTNDLPSSSDAWFRVRVQ